MLLPSLRPQTVVIGEPLPKLRKLQFMAMSYEITSLKYLKGTQIK